MKLGISSLWFLFLSLFIYPHSSHSDVFEAPMGRKTVLCSTDSGASVPVLRTAKGIITYGDQKKALAKAVKKAKGAKKVKAEKRYADFVKKMKPAQKACKNAQPPASPPPPPNVVPDAVSLAPYDGPVTKTHIRLFLERAGYGLSSRESNIVNIGLTQGLAAAVEEFTRVKPEPTGLDVRMRDRFDSTLGNSATQVADHLITNTTGYRAADLDFAINTNNPYRSNLQHFFLGLWTIGSNVLSTTQIPLWWDYWTNVLYKSALDPKLPDRLLEVSRHPFMLIYLDNNQNLAGNVNENYARELLELFSMAPERIDRTTNQETENYIEFRNGGDRTQGDIYRIARCLTGWRVSYLPDGQGINRWRSVYSSADHENCTSTLFEGQPFAFTINDDESIVRGIFANHPAPKDYIARELLKWYLTPQPPIELVRALGDEIQAAGFNLEEPLKKLFRSKAFYDATYVNTLPKNPHQLVTEFARTMELYRTDAVPANQEGGANIANLIGVISGQGNLSRMGFDVTRPPDVFYYPSRLWTSPDTLLDVANTMFNMINDTTSQARISWLPAKVLPTGDVIESDVIKYVADEMGCSLNDNMVTQLQYFVNNRYNGTTYTRTRYDNLVPEHQSTKGRYLASMTGMLPCFLNK